MPHVPPLSACSPPALHRQGLTESVRSRPMRSAAALATHLLRATLLALLVIGLLVRPVLNQLSDLHAVEHAMQDYADAQAHGHAHPDLDFDHAPDADHAHGAHVLMHSGDGNASTSPGIVPVVLASLPLTLPLPDPHLDAEPAFPPVSVFRPPIV